MSAAATRRIRKRARQWKVAYRPERGSHVDRIAAQLRILAVGNPSPHSWLNRPGLSAQRLVERFDAGIADAKAALVRALAVLRRDPPHMRPYNRACVMKAVRALRQVSDAEAALEVVLAELATQARVA